MGLKCTQGWSGDWNHAGLNDVWMEAEGDGVTPNTSRLKGMQVWNANIMAADDQIQKMQAEVTDLKQKGGTGTISASMIQIRDLLTLGLLRINCLAMLTIRLSLMVELLYGHGERELEH